MCEYFCSAFIDVMIKGKILADCESFFSPNNIEDNDKIIVNYLFN